MLALCRLVLCCSVLIVATGPIAGSAIYRGGAYVPAEAVGPVRVDRTVQGKVIGSRPPVVSLVTVDFADAAHGFLSTETGTCPGRGCTAALLATSNGGQTWQTVHTGMLFSSLSFVSPTRGFGVDGGGGLLVTRDGGRHWSAVPAPAPRASSVDFLDAQHGWLIAGQLYRAIHGGQDWIQLPFRCGKNQLIARVSFATPDTGFLLCSVMNGPFSVYLYRSDDGGTSWRPVSTVDSMAHDLGAFEFISPRIGFVSAGFGNLLQTTDGGRTFHQVPGTPFESVLAASWFGSRTGFVATFQVLMKTVDGGRDWQQLYPTLKPQGPISLTASGAGVGVGTSWFPAAILRTPDGVHWQFVRQTPIAVAGPGGEVSITSVEQLVRTPSGTVWAVAQLENGVTFWVYLLRSRDGGRHWKRMLSVPSGGGFLSFPGSRLGFFATGTRLYMTVDRGRTWARRKESVQTWNDQFVSATMGWAFGAQSTLLHTDDGGIHWQSVDVQVSDLRAADLYFLDPADGWITGTRCNAVPCTPVMLRTRDGDVHWVLIRLPQWFAFDGFDWVTPRLGYVLLNGGLYRTRDGGITWRLVGG